MQCFVCSRRSFWILFCIFVSGRDAFVVLNILPVLLFVLQTMPLAYYTPCAVYSIHTTYGRLDRVKAVSAAPNKDSCDAGVCSFDY